MKYLNKIFEDKISKEDITNIFIDIMDNGFKVDIVDYLWTQEIDIYAENDRLGHYLTFMNADMQDDGVNELFNAHDKAKEFMSSVRTKVLKDTNTIKWLEIKDDLIVAIDRLKEFGDFIKIKIFHRDMGFLYDKEYFEVPDEINIANVCSGIKIYIGSEKNIPKNKPGLINKFKEFFGKNKISEGLKHNNDEIECSYPPIAFNKYDLYEVLEKIENLKYIIEDEGYITNFDKYKLIEPDYKGCDINAYISKKTSNVDDIFSDELAEFLDRLISELPNFYFGSYGNTLRSDNLKDYIRSNYKSNGAGYLYFCFYIFKRKRLGIESEIAESIEHLKERGIEEHKTRFIYDEKSGDTFFFLYNLSGQMVGYQKYNPAYPKNQPQTVDPRMNKYFTWVGEEGNHKKIAVWGLETINFGDKYIFLTEGIFDCARIHKAGEPGIATLCNDPSTSMKNWLLSLPQKKIVIYDNDSAGRKLKKVGDFCFTVPSPYKDLGEMPQEEANEFIRNIKYLISNQKVNENLIKDNKGIKIDWSKMESEIQEILFILNDIGFKVELVDPVFLPNLMLFPKIHINSATSNGSYVDFRRGGSGPTSSNFLSKEDKDNFLPNYNEFIDRCSDICDRHGYNLKPLEWSTISFFDEDIYCRFKIVKK